MYREKVFTIFIYNLLIVFFYALQGPEQEKTSAKWSRASPPPLNPQTDTLTFQQIEIDHYIGNNFIFEIFIY